MDRKTLNTQARQYNWHDHWLATRRRRGRRRILLAYMYSTPTFIIGSQLYLYCLWNPIPPHQTLTTIHITFWSELIWSDFDLICCWFVCLCVCLFVLCLRVYTFSCSHKVVGVHHHHHHPLWNIHFPLKVDQLTIRHEPSVSTYKEKGLLIG